MPHWLLQVVLRLAPTWFRIGSLQILTSHAEVAELNKLVDFVIETNFSHLLSQVPDREDRLIAFYAQVRLHATNKGVFFEYERSLRGN